MNSLRGPLTALLLTLTLAAANPALANDNAAAAEILFNEAKELRDAGKLAQACPKFQASYKLDRTLGTLMNLADCREQLGQIATAWADWGEAMALANRQQDEREAFAQKRRDALTGRLPKLTVAVAKAVAGLDVYRGDTKLEPATYNVPLPVDPGEQILQVRRGERVLEEKRVTAQEQQQAELTFDLASLDAKFPPARATGSQGSGPGPGADRGPVDNTQKTVGYIVGGAGVVGILVGVTFGGLAIKKKNEADEPDACVEKYCTQKGLDAAEQARSHATVGQWVGLGGVLLTAVGATLLLTAPSGPERAATRRSWVASPWLAPGAGGLAVGGHL